MQLILNCICKSACKAMAHIQIKWTCNSWYIHNDDNDNDNDDDDDDEV